MTTPVDVVQVELAQLEQGLLQLRLQREEAEARLEQIEDAIQQQAGAIALARRLAEKFNVAPTAGAAG
jgi:hypothetical protein